MADRVVLWDEPSDMSRAATNQQYCIIGPEELAPSKLELAGMTGKA